jgi:protein-disulfide isomerase
MAEKHITPEAKKESSQYLEIPLPKFRFDWKRLKTNNYTPLLVIALIISSFLLGMLITKVQYLEQLNKTGTGTSPTVNAAGNTAPAGKLLDKLVAYADELDMDTKKFSACITDGKYKSKVDEDLAAGTEVGVSGTPGTFVNGQLITGALPYTEFKKLLVQEETGVPAEWPEGSTPGEKTEVATGTLPVRGNENAPITIIEFSDFQCPFCKRFYDDALAQMKKDYIDSGKAKFYFRHYPLNQIHPNAQMTAEASECANEQNKFWEFHDLLFQKQDEWANDSSA